MKDFNLWLHLLAIYIVSLIIILLFNKGAHK